MIYLDSAATSLHKPLRVEHDVIRAMRSMASPGRGGHPPAMLAAETVYACREEAAALFHMPDPSRVVFTMNATHGLNLAIRSLVRPGEPVLISGFEHNAVTRPLHALGADIRIAGRELFAPEKMLDEWERELPQVKTAVSTMVSNVFGYILPIKKFSALCKAYGVPLIVDASQGAGVLPLDFEALGAAFIAMPGHKGLLGPQGTGLLLCGEEGTPLIQGGSGSESMLQRMPDALPEHLEAGTHNVPGIAGLLEGIRYVREKGTDAILSHERALLDRALLAMEGSDLELYACPPALQSGVFSLRCPWMDCEELAAALGEKGVCVRAGLHCAPTVHESAGTLDTGTLRISFSPFVSTDEAVEACRILRGITENASRREG